MGLPKQTIAASSVCLLLTSLSWAGAFDDLPSEKAGRPAESVATEVFAKASKSVVMVKARTPAGEVQGSGVVYRTESLAEYLTWEGAQAAVKKGPVSRVVTNAHVVDRADRIVVLDDARQYEATIEFADDESDLASLLICGISLPEAPPYSAAPLKVGERVFAIGSPLGLGNSISEGIISSKRHEEDVLLLQTTAAISPGSSGGGLFDVRARFVGVTTFKVKGGENINFAVDAGMIGSVAPAARNRWEAKKLLRFGETLIDEGRYAEAVETLSAVVGRDPKSAAAYYQRGNAYRHLDDYKRGIEDCETAAHLGDARAEALLKLTGTEWDIPKPKRPQELVLTCKVGKEWKVSLKVDYANGMVNGIPARLTDTEITWLFPVFPEDFKVDESGKKRIDRVWAHVLNRRSGALNIGNVLSGQCSQAGEKKF